MENLLAFMIQGYLEIAGAIGVSLGLAGRPVRWKRCAGAALVLSAAVFAIKSLDLFFFAQTVVVVFAITLHNVKYYRLNIVTSLAAVLVAVVMVFAIETVFFLGLGKIAGVTMVVLRDNVWIWTAAGMPQALLPLGLAVILDRRNRSPGRGKMYEST